MSKYVVLSVFFIFGCVSKSVVLDQSIETDHRVPASKVQNDRYIGAIVLNGNLQLFTNKKKAELTDVSPGLAEVKLKDPHLFFHPIRTMKSERVLVLQDQNNEYVFRIPAKSFFSNNILSVKAKDSGQNADLVVKEKTELVNTKDEDRKVVCTYSGVCKTCAPDVLSNPAMPVNSLSCGVKYSENCMGSQPVIYKVNTYHRTLNLQLVNGSSSAEMNTYETEFKTEKLIKELGPCIPQSY